MTDDPNTAIDQDVCRQRCMIAISYRREDSLPIAGRLYDRLQAKFGKQNVFMDFDSIPPGVDFREKIKETIERSNLVIAVIGPHWLGEQSDGSRRIDDPTDFVRLEIDYALKAGIPVIPLLVNSTPMPKPEKMPADIEALAFRNALPLDSGLDFHQHTDRLINGIGNFIETTEATSGAIHPPPVKDFKDVEYRQTRSKQSIKYLVLALVPVAGVALLAWFAFPNRRDDKAVQPPTEGATSAQVSKEKKAKDEAKSIASTTRDNPFVNSLGMKFVAVPETQVLFSIWDTRVRDYQAFADATGRSWERPSFEGPTDPAVMVSWEDAKAFCAWLTERERNEGNIAPDQQYRLPTDEEWSVAAGLPHESGRTPAEKDGKIKNVYPWGNQWPPPKGAGNYDQSLHMDSYERISPVGSFNANKYGLYDMGGNVWQWCENWYDDKHEERVLRGDSWLGGGVPKYLLSSGRDRDPPSRRLINRGFRVVVAGSASKGADTFNSNSINQTNLPRPIETPAAERPAPPPKTKKLFAGTWEGTIDRVHDGAVAVGKRTLTINEDETQVGPGPAIKGIDNGARKLTFKAGGVGFQSITVNEDGRTAIYEEGVEALGGPQIIFRGVLHKKG